MLTNNIVSFEQTGPCVELQENKLFKDVYGMILFVHQKCNLLVALYCWLACYVKQAELLHFYSYQEKTIVSNVGHIFKHEKYIYLEKKAMLVTYSSMKSTCTKKRKQCWSHIQAWKVHVLRKEKKAMLATYSGMKST